MEAEDKLFIGVGVSDHGTAGLSLSLESNGDMYVFFGRRELAELIEALRAAYTVATSGNHSTWREVHHG